jgi:hypothetical protein
MARKKREGISTKTRFDVFKRDGFVCQYCGAHPPQVILHVDHIIAVAEGGANDMDNYTTSCDRCNLGKGPRSLKSAPMGLAEKAAITAEKEAQLRGFSEIMMARRDRLEDEAWQITKILEPESKNFRKDWLLSIKKFLGRLGLFEVCEAAEIASAKGFYSDHKRFSYFCGVCWSKIRALEGQQ